MDYLHGKRKPNQTFTRITREAKKHNVTCLSPKNLSPLAPLDSKGKREWQEINLRCNICNTEFKRLLPNLYKKYAYECPVCQPIQEKERGKQGKKRIKEANLVAKAYRSKCVDTTCRNKQTRIRFKCPRGHAYITSITNHKQNVHIIKCKKCRYEEKLIKIKQFLKCYGVEFLSEEYQGIGHRHLFKCKDGHQWDDTMINLVSTFQRNGTICLQCRVLKTIKENPEFDGFTLLSDSFQGTYNDLRWKCNNCEHIFELPLSLLRSRKIKCKKCLR